MASVVQNKRTSESKFVSICADGGDGSPDVDISFREPLLSRPSDHYMIGVDNLTVNLNHAAMLRTSDGPEDFMFQIGRIGRDAAIPTYRLDDNGDPILGEGDDTPMEDSFAAADAIAIGLIFKEDAKFRVTRNYQNIQHLIRAMNDHVAQYSSELHAGIAANASGYGTGYNVVVPGAADNAAQNLTAAMVSADTLVKHVYFSLRADGVLRLYGTRAFWSNYFVYCPNAEYQYMLFGDRETNPYFALDFNGKRIGSHFILRGEDAAAPPNQLAVFLDLEDTAGYTEYPPFHNITTQATLAVRNTIAILYMGASFIGSSDRRIALEIGSSLPIVNNPMVDHNNEHPDFVLGRWMWNPRIIVNASHEGDGTNFTGIAPSVHEFQTSADRVQYHSLMPQDKIQFLRLKMYCRIRVYNAERDRFDMDTIVMPMTKTDWWHCRLHFVSKD